MDYSNYSIHLLKPMDELDLDRIFPWPDSKRKRAFKLITDGMTVSEWQAKVDRAGLEKVDVSFITQCYAKDEPHRFERKLVELRENQVAGEATNGKAVPDEMTRYEVILYWSTKDEAFIAEVPELQGCAANGATRQEAIANAEIAIAQWMETARGLGRPVPAPRGRLFFA